MCTLSWALIRFGGAGISPKDFNNSCTLGDTVVVVLSLIPTKRGIVAEITAGFRVVDVAIKEAFARLLFKPICAKMSSTF